jgi:Flp pilus assembly protein TadB
MRADSTSFLDRSSAVIIGVLIFLAALIISLMRGTPRVTSFLWLKKQYKLEYSILAALIRSRKF